IVAKKETNKDEINNAVKRAAEQQLKGILGYTNDPNVSIDFNHDPHSATFHMDQTKVMNGTLVRVMAWYDNEWGFSNRMADTAVTRIERVAPTITEIAGRGGKVILLAHFGRPKGRDPKESLKPIAAKVGHIIKKHVAFADDCVDEAAEKAVAAMKNGDVLLLE